MECLPSLHLHIDGCGGGTAWSPVQQPQYFTLQISFEVPSQEKKNMAVCI